MHIKHLFNAIRDYEYSHVKDGREFWQHIKILCNTEVSVPFKQASEECIAKILELPEEINNELVIPNHFIRQLVRIPQKTEGMCNVQKILQIALNIGQWMNNPIDEYHEVFIKNDMMRISSYLSDSSIKELNSVISDSEFIRIMNLL